MRLIACMVTSGRAADAHARAHLVERVRAAADAGVDLVQLREPGLEARALTELAGRCLTALRGRSTRLLVNDRLDVALAAGAHGVHLRGDSFPAPRVRRVTPPGFLIGRSVRTADEAARAAEGGGLDYLIAGTIFASPSKPGTPAAGLEMLSAIVQAVRLPVLAIGGIERDKLAALAAAGAAGFAAITLFAGEDPLRLTHS